MTSAKMATRKSKLSMTSPIWAERLRSKRVSVRASGDCDEGIASSGERFAWTWVTEAVLWLL